MILPFQILLAIVPVIVFLCVLVLLDSYRLVSFPSIFFTIAAGALAAVVCYTLSMLLRKWIPEPLYQNYGAPFLEETVKALVIVVLFQKKRIGFVIDAVIYGFAAGTGFAVTENIDYLLHLEGAQPLTWMVRGFGTAVMHGSTTGIFAMISQNFLERKKRKEFLFLPGL